MLRDGALSDDKVIDLVNAEFVPAWINIRTTPVPDVSALDTARTEVPMDADRNVAAGFSRTFLVRSVAMTPDGKTALNPDSCGGGFPITKADDYLAMLRGALERYRAPKAR